MGYRELREIVYFIFYTFTFNFINICTVWICHNKHISSNFKGGKEKKEKYHFTVLGQIHHILLKY